MTSRRKNPTDILCSTSRMRRGSLLRRLVLETVTTTTSLTTLQEPVLMTAGTVSMTLNTPISARAQRKRVKKEKLFLMSWCPDSAKIKKKMLYSSSFDALKKCLVGVQKYIQATDESEASAESVEEQLRKTDRV